MTERVGETLRATFRHGCLPAGHGVTERVGGNPSGNLPVRLPSGGPWGEGKGGRNPQRVCLLGALGWVVVVVCGVEGREEGGGGREGGRREGGGGGGLPAAIPAGRALNAIEETRKSSKKAS